MSKETKSICNVAPEGAPRPPIQIIRKKYYIRQLLVLVAMAAGMGFAFVATVLQLSSGYAILPFAILGVGSMICAAFLNLDLNCPKCNFNIVMGTGWHQPFGLKKTYYCPHCKLNLSEPYPAEPSALDRHSATS